MLENKLRFEKSPYLRQHESNPVAWQPWSDEAFRLAAELNCPVFLSIGYSTCYWCHVMEEESFESEEVAALLNESFISIKVDREERPDLDQIYMDAVVGISGSGGWPMSVFLTPERKPFFGGTYLPKAKFVPLLKKIAEVWAQDPDSILISAEKILSFLQGSTGKGEIDYDSARSAVINYFERSFDREHGGFGDAPKFPQSLNLEYLLCLNDNPSAREMVKLTLTSLSLGGIYDHLGGGFHRYATDNRWRIPHFEKMLYDNALLAGALLRGYRAFNEPLFLDRGVSTLDFLLSELQHPDGGFYAALDAGEPGHEGEYYLWEYGELEHALSEAELELLEERAEVTPRGNFEGRGNILFGLDEYQNIREKLLRLRNVRERPFTDKKIITAWNALAISGLIEGYQTTRESRFLDAAIRAESFCSNRLYVNEKLYRSWCDGVCSHEGFLEDYSYLVQALLDLYLATGEFNYLQKAYSTQQQQDSLFWDDVRGGYFFAPKELEGLIVRKKDFNDGATPAGNSVSALNLLRLHQLTGERVYLERFAELKSVMAPFASKYPGAYVTFLRALDFESRARSIVVSTKSQQVWQESCSRVFRSYLPQLTLLRADERGPLLARKPVGEQTHFYLCDQTGCAEPVQELEVLMEKL